VQRRGTNKERGRRGGMDVIRRSRLSAEKNKKQKGNLGIGPEKESNRANKERGQQGGMPQRIALAVTVRKSRPAGHSENVEREEGEATRMEFIGEAYHQQRGEGEGRSSEYT